MDRDGDGLLDKEELIAYQIRLTEHNNRKQINAVFEKHDEDGNGIVTFAEVWVHGEEGMSHPMPCDMLSMSYDPLR